MIDFDDELKKFHKSMDIEDIDEVNLGKRDIDVTSLIVELLSETETK